jgi:hypothetical protein
MSGRTKVLSAAKNNDVNICIYNLIIDKYEIIYIKIYELVFLL